MSQGASGGHRWRTSVGTAASHGSSLKTKRRAWATLAVALGGVVVWLLFLILGAGKPLQSQIVSIGMTYDNPIFRPTPFLMDSANAFEELHQRTESKDQFLKSNYVPRTKLDGPEVLDILRRDLSLTKNQNLLVYLNLQGGVIERTGETSGAAACFLTLRAGPDSLHEAVDGQRVPVQELLAECGKISAANVVVLLEAGDCGPNWRAGILNRDFVAQLKKEVEQAVHEYPKLRVIGAVSDGESAQASRQFGDGPSRSVFSHFAVQGLLGEADGWKFDPNTGKSSPPLDARKRSVRTVSFDELFAYMHGSVEDWWKTHRAAQQTVWRFPESSPRLELAQIRAEGRLARTAKAAKEAVEPNSKSSDKEKPGEKDSASVSKENLKDAPDEKAADEKAKTKSTDLASADSTKTSAAESPKEAKPTEDKKSSTGKVETAATDDGTKSNKNEDPEELRAQLLGLWTRRDLARQAGLAALIAPREWRRLQLELIHAEQCLRDGDDLGRVKEELREAEVTFGKIGERVRALEVQRQRPANELVSLAFVSLIATPPPVANADAPPPADSPSTTPNSGPSEPTAAEQKQFAVLLKLAFPNESDPAPPNASPKPAPPATAPDTKVAAPASEPPKHDELRKLLGKHPQLRGRVWQEAFRPILKLAQQAKEDGRVVAADFLKGFAAISLAEDLTQYPVGRSTIPAELVTVLGVLAVAEKSTKEQIPWTPDLSRACGQLIDLRVRFEQFATRSMTFSKMLGKRFSEVENPLIDAERWVQVGQADQALQRLKQAEGALASAITDVETLQLAAQLKANIASELPDLTRWVARRQEAGGQDSIKSTRKVLRSFAESRQTSETISADELNELRNFVRAQNETWFGLFDVVEQTTELFRATAFDLKQAGTPSSLTTQTDAVSFSKISTLTNSLNQSWSEWRSLDLEVNALLSATTPTAGNWTRINDALLVPWISADNRRRLLNQLDQLDQSEGRRGSDETRAAAVRGDWQAFWAIETLRLAGLDTKAEQELWDKFSKSLKTSTESDEIAESFAASAGLGRAIASAFAKLARNADSAATELASKLDNIDPTRAEQLTRGVDPADRATPGAQAEFWFAKWLSRELDEFVHDRVKQMSQIARLDGNDLRPQWTSLAERWKSLSNSAINLAAAEESPFTLGKISDEQLGWSRSDPAEIKLTLIASPRPGAKYRETLIRLLDADALNVDPPKLTDGVELEKSEDPQSIPLRFEKPKNATTVDFVVLVALLDKETQRPWDVQRLALRTPQKDQDWRIEFRSKEEIQNPDSPANQKAVSDRNKPDRTKRSDETEPNQRIVLRLPTTSREGKPGKPLSLQPVLIPPPGSKVSSVAVKVYEVDENGKQRTTHSGEQIKVAMNREGRPIPLSLAVVPTPPAATPAKPDPSATPSPAGKDVSRGWIFEILPEGEATSIRQHVVPRVRPPETYFNPTKVRVTFSNGELKVELQRRPDEEELDRALRPETVQVKLELPKALDELRTDNQLIWNFNPGERKNLVSRFDEQRLSKLKEDSFIVFVNVAGWPRAFPYQIRHGKPAVEYPATRPVIVAPPAGLVISEGEKLSVDVQIDSDRLNTFGLDEPWKLACELVSTTKSDISLRPKPTEICRSLHESITLISQGENEWLLTAEVRNHRVEFNTNELRGRFFVRATASCLDDKSFPPGGGKADEVRIAIADPKHLPPQPKPIASSLEKIRPGTETDWKVTISAKDPEAGIAEVAVGFDLDQDDQLGEKEIIPEATRKWSNPLDEDERRETLTIPAVRFKNKPTGKYNLLVRAKNGVGQFCEKPLIVTLEVTLAMGWVEVAEFAKRDAFVLLIDDKETRLPVNGRMLIELPIGLHKFQLANSIVKDRKGLAKQVMVTKENTADDPATVSVSPPQ